MTSLLTIFPNMRVSKSNLCTFFLLSAIAVTINGDPIVPALCIFGDSVVDVGNNNHLLTLIKSNFPPYGRDFPSHKPTGRFCNGKLALDFTAEFLGFDSYPPAYLSRHDDSDVVSGANFASAGSGYYDQTSHLWGALSLRKQVEYYMEWQARVKSVDRDRADRVFSRGIHIVSTGSSDYLQNYYVNPLARIVSRDQFSDILIGSYSAFVQSLYELGARRIGATSLPPIGCLPAAITLFGTTGSNDCVAKLNQDAVSFNSKLRATSLHLKTKLPGLKLVVFDVYGPLLDMITNPSDNGFSESRRACCGTGLVETSFLCNKLSIGTCRNATEYMFWDGFHPSEAANEELANKLLEQGFELVSDLIH